MPDDLSTRDHAGQLLEPSGTLLFVDLLAKDPAVGGPEKASLAKQLIHIYADLFDSHNFGAL